MRLLQEDHPYGSSCVADRDARRFLASDPVRAAVAGLGRLHRVREGRALEPGALGRDRAGARPQPSIPEAVVQVYAARTWGWKGAFAVHTWIAFKPRGCRRLRPLRGGGLGRGQRRAGRTPQPSPAGRTLGRQRSRCCWSICAGPRLRHAIPKLQDAIARYPYAESYLTWPGPNSNTFVAWLGREVPELRPDPAADCDRQGLPRRPDSRPRTPSGTGLQLSLGGLLGISVGVEEGLELNLLGLVIGLDPQEAGASSCPGSGDSAWAKAADGRWPCSRRLNRKERPNGSGR